MKPRIAIISFPGTNGDVENLRAFERCGFDPFFFRWNDNREKLEDVDGYFIGAGFSYEDRGRAGMVAGRDSIFQHLHSESTKGKVIVGNCNGCQVLVESELIPVGNGLRMCMARNVVDSEAVGFLNQWVWLTPSCASDRCAVANWKGTMHVPIAHGEGRFTTKDRELIEELRQNDQVALSYCDEEGNATDRPPYCPNGALFGAAAICNPAGNVVGCMPHPERTENGDPYFHSILSWIEKHRMPIEAASPRSEREAVLAPVPSRQPKPVEIFIGTIITNNEERTVEQAARKIVPALSLRQLRYIAPGHTDPKKILGRVAIFNANKETAYIRREGKFFLWNAEQKKEEPLLQALLEGIVFLRRDEPDTGSHAIGAGSETGTCYVCKNGKPDLLHNRSILNIFGNPHASTLEQLT